MDQFDCLFLVNKDFFGSIRFSFIHYTVFFIHRKNSWKIDFALQCIICTYTLRSYSCVAMHAYQYYSCVTVNIIGTEKYSIKIQVGLEGDLKYG